MEIRKLNKKGAVFDIQYVISGLLVLALILIISSVMWNHVEPELSTQFADYPEAQSVLDAGTTSIGMFVKLLLH